MDRTQTFEADDFIAQLGEITSFDTAIEDKFKDLVEGLSLGCLDCLSEPGLVVFGLYPQAFNEPEFIAKYCIMLGQLMAAMPNPRLSFFKDDLGIVVVATSLSDEELYKRVDYLCGEYPLHVE